MISKSTSSPSDTKTPMSETNHDHPVRLVIGFVNEAQMRYIASKWGLDPDALTRILGNEPVLRIPSAHTYILKPTTERKPS